MTSNRIKKLAAAKAKVAALESSIAAELNAALRSLPARFGYADVHAFVAAVRAAAGSRRRFKAKSGMALPRPKVLKTRRKRAVITDATRGEVRKLVEAGKTGTAIAKALRISLPSVQNIKKALGLVKNTRSATK